MVYDGHAWGAAVAVDSAHPDVGTGPSAHSPGRADTALTELSPNGSGGGINSSA